MKAMKEDLGLIPHKVKGLKDGTSARNARGLPDDEAAGRASRSPREKAGSQ